MNSIFFASRFLFIFLLVGLTNCQAGGDLSGDVNGEVQLTCPTGYLRIPGLSPYTIKEFCVMKYEAKLEYQNTIVLDGNLNTGDGLGDNYDTDYETQSERDKYKAVSDASGQPWVNIFRGDTDTPGEQGAIEACQELGADYNLINNNQWQSIARNIEAVASNWNTDSLGDVILSSGHSDSDPAQSCDAVSEYVDGDCNNGTNESDFEEKRTHTLISGEVIWDFAGNIREMIRDNHLSTVYQGNFAWDYWVDVDIIGFPLVQNQFGPANITNPLCDNPTGTNKCGYGRLLDFDGTSKAIRRGGGFVDGLFSGVFNVVLQNTPTNLGGSRGFRCVYAP